ncbi:Peroxisomal NADH pyrophosphatase NUDT12 [Hondaea fermentalgiana]|uniref:NAD(+) diphosphatase n=1 Tax=Hondaea fermentalgiana TaxID=2315210 RepID=A0A2R5GR29_9STRA|nr:Peroxisomal NADH pyrophosphatase NUDT12 [Hondaea fermentalgiana]|eukprot:GBG33337.1 Peroxisomal NADH pyrophosphatase NUDT12 [Hondaea fermentalgiana]
MPQAQTQRRFYRIERQFWSSLPLDRHPLPELHDDEVTGEESTKVIRKAFEDPDSRFLLFSEGQIGTQKDGGLAWWTWKEVSALPSWRARELEEDGGGTSKTDGDDAGRTVVLLGRRKQPGDVDYEHCGETSDAVLTSAGWRFVCDVSGVNAPALDDVNFVRPNSLMDKLPSGEAAVMGQAVSRMNWHMELSFSPRTGAAMTPAGCGHRRRDWSQENRRKAVFYPRTDPVAIMLVQSPDGERCLLGKTKRRAGGNLYSCLAGFVEQCESVESACRREVFEESGIRVGEEVQVVGTQPWPLGAAGHCELMIGCIARATSEKIDMDIKEMADVRWFTRAEALEMLERSRVPGAMSKPELGQIVPPSWAIAHHLIKAWAENDVWVGPGQVKSLSQGSAAADSRWITLVASGFAGGIATSLLVLKGGGFL